MAAPSRGAREREPGFRSGGKRKRAGEQDASAYGAAVADRWLIAIEELDVDESTARDIRRGIESVLAEAGVPGGVGVLLADGDRYQVSLKPKVETPVLNVHLN